MIDGRHHFGEDSKKSAAEKSLIGNGFEEEEDWFRDSIRYISYVSGTYHIQGTPNTWCASLGVSQNYWQSLYKEHTFVCPTLMLFSDNVQGYEEKRGNGSGWFALLYVPLPSAFIWGGGFFSRNVFIQQQL